MEEWRQGDKGKGHAVETVVNLFEVPCAETGLHLCTPTNHCLTRRRHNAILLFPVGKASAMLKFRNNARSINEI